MLRVTDDVATLRRKYAAGFHPFKRSLIWDVYSAIPWNRIGCAVYDPPLNLTGPNAAGATVFVLLDLVRMFKMYRMTIVIHLYNDASGIWAFVKLIFQLFITCHYVGCFWFRVATEQMFASEFDGGDTWLSGTGIVPDGVRIPGNWAMEYVTSLYWVVTTMSTVGYGDLLPQTVFERFMTMWVMIGGVAFFATITGTISEVISSSARSVVRFDEFIGEVDEFIKVAQIPEQQKTLILQFFELKYPDKNIFNDEGIVGMLPSGLRRQLLTATYGVLMEKSPLFHGLADTTLQQICGEIHVVPCIPDEVITMEGKEPDAFFVVRHGYVQLWRNGHKLGTIGPGKMFGEIAIFGLTDDGLRLRTAASLTQCELLKLGKQSFMPLLLQNQDLRKRYRSMAARQIERVKVSAEKDRHRIMWDKALSRNSIYMCIYDVYDMYVLKSQPALESILNG